VIWCRIDASVKYDRAACTSRHGSTGTATRMNIPSPYLTWLKIADWVGCWLLSCGFVL